MARLYSDENFPLPVVEELRRLGHDVLTIVEDGQANCQFPDEAVLQQAAAQNRAVLTLNRKHFWRLHELAREHAGIILCTSDKDFIGQAHRINQLLQTEDSLTGRLVRVKRPATDS